MLSTTQRVIGLIFLGASGLLAAETVYEQTFLTYWEGPQMIGFTLAHEHIGFLLFGMAGTLGLYVWSTMFLIAFGYRRTKRGQKALTVEWLQLGASVLVLSVCWIPYEWWQFSTVEIAGPGARAADELTAAASTGHRYLVDALLRSGVNVDSPNRYKQTALGNSCSAGQKGMADYLISRGANLNSAPECRRYSDFAAKMKTEPTPPDDGLPKVPGETVVVTASPYN